MFGGKKLKDLTEEDCLSQGYINHFDCVWCVLNMKGARIKDIRKYAASLVTAHGGGQVI